MTLEQDARLAQHQLATLSASLDAAEHAHTDLEAHLGTSETALAAAQQQLANATFELTSHARQLHATHADVASTATVNEAHSTEAAGYTRGGTNLCGFLPTTLLTFGGVHVEWEAM